MSPEFTFEVVRPDLGYGPNDRVHWATRARRAKEIRTTVYLMGSLRRREKVCIRPATVRYVVTWAKGKRRLNDADNLIGQLKPFTDGLVSAGLLHDDSPAWLTLLPVEQVKGSSPMLSVRIEISWDSGSPRPQER